MISKKLFFVIFMFCLLSLSLKGQGRQDSIKLSAALDSITVLTEVDSLSGAVNNLPNKAITKVDSVTARLNTPIDSVTRKITTLQNVLKEKLDSLNAQGQPTGKIQQQLDSAQRLSNLPDQQYQKLMDVEEKLKAAASKLPGADTLQALGGKAKEKVNAINEISNEVGIGTLGGEVKTGINTDLPNVSSINLPKTNNAQLPTLPSNTLNAPNINAGAIPKTQSLGDVPKLNATLPGELTDIQGKASELGNLAKEAGQITQQADEYSKEIKTIQESGITKSEKLPELAEQQVLKIDEVKELQQQQLGAIGQLTEQQKLLEQYKNEKAIEAEIKEKLREVANDVIATQQTKISADIKKMAKHMRKFSEVKDMRELPRRAPNPLKGLPLRERVMPGFVMQTYGGTNVWLQIDPQIYYKLNGKWSAGMGGMYRFSMDPKKLTFDNFENLYGAKAFVQWYAIKGFFLRAEGQQLSWKPWNTASKDPNYREQTSIAAIGIGRSHFVAKKIKANVQTLYHFAWGGADPYKSKIMIRFGFDFSLKKREVKPWEKKLKDLNKSTK